MQHAIWGPGGPRPTNKFGEESTTNFTPRFSFFFNQGVVVVGANGQGGEGEGGGRNALAVCPSSASQRDNVRVTQAAPQVFRIDANPS